MATLIGNKRCLASVGIAVSMFADLLYVAYCATVPALCLAWAVVCVRNS
jgi:hypothetical protein